MAWALSCGLDVGNWKEVRTKSLLRTYRPRASQPLLTSQSCMLVQSVDRRAPEWEIENIILGLERIASPSMRHHGHGHLKLLRCNVSLPRNVAEIGAIPFLCAHQAA
eukprot:428731-Amphidinium_carterae.1